MCYYNGVTWLTEKVDHHQRVFETEPERPGTLEVRLVQQERGEIRREYGRVDDQQQYDPVPDRLERAVMEYGPFVDFRRLELVLGQYVGAQRQHLRHNKQSRDAAVSTNDGVVVARRILKTVTRPRSQR